MESQDLWDNQTLKEFQVKNYSIINNNYVFKLPTGYPVLNFIENFPLFHNIKFTKSTSKRYINKKYVSVKKCNTAYKYSNWLRKNNSKDNENSCSLCSTNRLDDEYEINAYGIEKLRYNTIKKKKI
ncbi:hypothetical protein LY90DRAFT_515196 [Neocallimastix californiae]|uniref:Uncharacterized protein n=1 Tax=Neocallimastix californiae TaxID=1754190 RepID=A0A1Y2AKC9_9FUNG|nr:hypothetical protein LY90DRAFT_515196 [Neocallimastix californiae]|eukprot:ORY23001.1 hypothetical protein LY90DRAFT_515196 [Neocallimastix californiae]